VPEFPSPASCSLGHGPQRRRRLLVPTPVNAARLDAARKRGLLDAYDGVYGLSADSAGG